MKSFLKFLKKFAKFIIVGSIVLFIVIFTVIFLYEQHKKNELLEERLNKLETLKTQSVETPDQVYAQSRIHIKYKEYDAALEKLMQLKANYPYWHKEMVDKSINAVKGLTNKIDQEQTDLEEKLDRLATGGDINENTNENVTASQSVTTERKFQFRKFEYEDTKFPLKTSNSGHNRKLSSKDRKTGNVYNKDGSITGQSNDYAFKKFEFEDNRYKKNIQPVVESGTKISDPNKQYSYNKNSSSRAENSVKSGNKGFQKHKFEDKRYKKNIQPVVESGTKISDPHKSRTLKDVKKADTSKTSKKKTY